jgi:hypothetical protein
MMIIIIIINY